MRYRRNAGFGPLRIRAELSQKGVSGTLINRELEAVADQWHTSLQGLVARKYGPQPASTLSEKAKRQRFLAQRGFSFDQIHQVIS